MFMEGKQKFQTPNLTCSQPIPTHQDGAEIIGKND